MARFRWGAATDVGRLRTANEDAYSADERLFVVADGMGGHLAGEVAAAMAVDALRDRLNTSVTADIDTLIEAVDIANRQIFQASHTRVDQHGMGTTLTAIAPVRCDGEVQLGLVNVGDSRAYRVRGGRLTQLSVDHSYVQELIATGQLTAMEARSHPHRNIVTRALGIEPVVRIDAWTMTIVAGDRFILCSDGLVDEVLDSIIGDLALDIADPQQAAERMVATANRNGGRDNITVVVVDVLEGADAITTELALDLEPHLGGELAHQGRWADDHSGDITPPGVVGGATLRIVPAESVDTYAASGPDAGVDFDVDLGPEGDDITRAVAKPLAARRAPATNHAAVPTFAVDATIEGAEFEPPQAHDMVTDPRVSVESDTLLRPTRPRRGLGSLAFVTAVAAVFVVGFVMIAAYARSGYFVDYRGNDIVVYKGRPDGVLWFDPTVAAIATQKRSDLPAADVEALGNRPEFDSLASALTYVETHSTTAPNISIVDGVPTTSARTPGTVATGTVAPDPGPAITTATGAVPTIGSIDGGATTETTPPPGASTP